MVNEAQTEIAAFASQISGGPLNVTNILAAIDSGVSDTRERAKVGGALPSCSVMKVLIQMHSNPIIDVDMNEIFMSINAL